MEKIKGNKKNIVIAAALIAVLAIGSTCAYFVDRDSVTNYFTVGDVEISVEEPNWDEASGENILPNSVISKDPQIKNTGANEAYVFMKVRVPNRWVQGMNEDGTFGESGEQDVFTYAVNNGWTLIDSNTVPDDASEYVYAYTNGSGNLNALAINETTNPIFDEVKFININEGNVDGENLEIKVEGLAIQTTDLGTSNPLEIYNIIMNGDSTPV